MFVLDECLSSIREKSMMVARAPKVGKRSGKDKCSERFKRILTFDRI